MQSNALFMYVLTINEPNRLLYQKFRILHLFRHVSLIHILK